MGTTPLRASRPGKAAKTVRAKLAKLLFLDTPGAFGLARFAEWLRAGPGAGWAWRPVVCAAWPAASGVSGTLAAILIEQHSRSSRGALGAVHQAVEQVGVGGPLAPAATTRELHAARAAGGAWPPERHPRRPLCTRRGCGRYCHQACTRAVGMACRPCCWAAHLAGGRVREGHAERPSLFRRGMQTQGGKLAIYPRQASHRRPSMSRIARPRRRPACTGSDPGGIP